MRTDVPGGGDRLNDIVWLHLDGRPMDEDDWGDGAKAIGMYLNGHGIEGKDARGGAITDDHFLLYFNADGDATVTLPASEYAERWAVVVDTGGWQPAMGYMPIHGDSISVNGVCLTVIDAAPERSAAMRRFSSG